jgi:hypothetical protein
MTNIKLKREYLLVSHDGPTFTDKKGKYDYCTWDILRKYGIDYNKVIPIYFDLNDFKKIKKGK